ncbi:hypothetical protein [Streptomyces alanosinicus]|uniref:DUF3558 domain-containing protein n=1 Tax=Streptomyces alanosinicus TaxID=68171 RepID=A0A919D0E9_9ACTN|nr:hypothetical protein [Streptomyces alanosinicus]GHD99323.1 hypothetical protein GCM10010339_10170 [Streptomyces alanosinicus]
MTSIRHALVTTVLACAALTLTACQPDDGTDAGAAVTPSATASHAGKAGGQDSDKGSGKGSGKGSDKGGAKSACHTLAPGHKYVQVESVSGAMNTLTTKDATQNCNPDEGAFYQAKGKEHEYTVASGATPIYVLHVKKKGPAKMTAAGGGIEHVRICADGTAQDTGTPADTSDCYGENFYDVVVNSAGKLTEMTELYGS